MPRQVLIVDDERETNELLAELVRARGFDPVQLYEGDAVLGSARNLRPELILLDIMLPDRDGFSVCEQLKMNRETNMIPVLMVTALGDHEHHVQGIRVGANGYLAKPFTPTQIYMAIDQALVWSEEHRHHGTTGEIQFDVRSELSHLHEINDLLVDLYSRTPLSERQVRDLKQAVLEMASNAVEWGHRRNADLTLRITYRIDHNCVTLVIRDQGPGFNSAHVPHAASEDNPIGHLDVRNDLGLREGGFGIMLARGLVDEFRYNDCGNEVTLIKRFAVDPD